MNANTFKGYFLVIASGLILLAIILLVALQWGNSAEFSAYGKVIDIDKQDGSTTGGVNVALLMLLSAIGGILVWHLTKVLWSGIRALLKGRKQENETATKRRLDKLESQKSNTSAG